MTEFRHEKAGVVNQHNSDDSINTTVVPFRGIIQNHEIVPLGLAWSRAIDAWCEQLASPGTRRNYRATMVQFFTPLTHVTTLEELRIQHIREWRGAMVQRSHLDPGQPQRISSATANRHIAAMRAFFTYWRKMSPDEDPHLHFSADQQLIALEHLRGQLRRPYQVLKESEIPALLDAAATPQNLASTPYPNRVMRQHTWRRVYRGKDARFAERDVVILTVALATGLRAAELSALNVGDLYESGGAWWLDVRHGKGNKRRRVEISELDAATVIDYITSTDRNFAAAADRATALWVSRRQRTGTTERRLCATQIQRIVDSIADLAQAQGLLAPGKVISPHALRHTYAINMLRGDKESGRRPATIVEVQFRLGHTDMNATKRYVEHLAEEEMIGLTPTITRRKSSQA